MPASTSYCCGVYYHSSNNLAEKQIDATTMMNGDTSRDDNRVDDDRGILLDALGKPQSGRNLQTLQPTPANMHHSAGITYANQDKLPRLPIPHLFETLTKFQARLEALQDEAQRAETAEIVREFLENDGPVLQEHLYEYEEEGIRNHEIGSYVEEFWNESYLSPDSSVVLNLNPYFVLEDAPDPKIAKDQIRRAASLCFAALKMASLLKHEALPPDTFKGRALCMDQFKALFGSSRQPNVRGVSDDVHVYNDSIHVVVLCKNQFYYFTGLWPDTGDVAVDEADIIDILKAIHAHTSETEISERSRNALGVFTSLPRSQWAVAREDLCNHDESNRSALHVIDSALFVLVLDAFVPENIHRAAANMLHGTNVIQGTTQIGSCLNRWYDKLQLIVTGDGTAGLVFEHSIIDGHTALRFTSDIFAETVISFAESIVDLIHGRGRITHVLDAKVDRAANFAADKDHHHNSSNNDQTQGRPPLDVLPKKLIFNLPESITDRIYYAETALCDDILASDTYVLEFRDYGKRLIVANKMSPDAYVQMSILLAYYNLYGKVENMYEPALTKQFFHGRTEAIRGCTVQAKKLCEIWTSKHSTPDQKLNALRTAIKEHSRLTQEASMGLGVDRHLFALKCMAIRKGMRIPKFFKSEAYALLNHTVLSTSNCGNPCLRLFGFGPVVSDGFGIGYIIKDNGIFYGVNSRHRQTCRYVHSLQQTLQDMAKLLEPISSVEVKLARRGPALNRMKDALTRHPQSSFGDYGDMWGENRAISQIKAGLVHDEHDESNHDSFPRLLRRQSSASRYFSTVTQKEKSVKLLLSGPSDKYSIDVSIGEHESSEDEAQ